MLATDSGVLRVFRFRPTQVAFDALLRDVIVPDLGRVPGLIDVYVGRQGPGEYGPRLVASVWHSEEAMSDGPSDALHDVLEGDLQASSLRFGLKFDTADPPTVLRLVDGRVGPGQLEDYVREARAGTLDDADKGQGPSVLYLATNEPDAFRTLSAWRDWSTLQAATGGDINRPIATRHAERLVAWEAAHYEVIPNLVRPGSSVVPGGGS